MLAPALLAIAIAASGAAMWGEAGAHAAGSAAGADTAAFGPTFEAIDLAIDPRTETWSGSLEADVSVRREARRMLLRLAGPVVNRVSLSDSSGRISTVFAQRGAELLLIEAA
ncbi:MAG TPA: hypothetical protein VMH61_01190, partial [Candidatus Acidoferrales bacterium]|nr:hypothetical protein [Candidatus Acidoferrales bacterium]